MATPRPVNPDVLNPYAVTEMRPQIGAEGVRVWRYTVLIPVEQILADGTERQVATAQDRNDLEVRLADHFGGVTVPLTVPGLRGFGPRVPQIPDESRELNRHASVSVYAAVHEASDAYFRAVRMELQDALGEGVILIERQDVMLV